MGNILSYYKNIQKILIKFYEINLLTNDGSNVRIPEKFRYYIIQILLHKSKFTSPFRTSIILTVINEIMRCSKNSAKNLKGIETDKNLCCFTCLKRHKQSFHRSYLAPLEQHYSNNILLYQDYMLVKYLNLRF